jgi:hypothetical protein
MKHLLVFYLLLFLAMLSTPYRSDAQEKFPGKNTLKELPVELVLDFYENENVAGASMPVLSEKGDIFFYDGKLNQLLRTHLDDQKVIPISRIGDGPKEYGGGIHSLIVQDNFLYVLDYKYKLLCFTLKGEFKWEEPTRGVYLDIVGKYGDSFFLSRYGVDDIHAQSVSLIQWTKTDSGAEKKKLLALPMQVIRTDAIFDGKVVKGAGIYTLSKPVFSLYKDELIGAAGTEYKLDFFDFKGKPKRSIRVEAPSPEPSKMLKKMNATPENTYTVMDVFSNDSYIIVVSSYFKEDKPRIDFFSPGGKLVKSYVLPFPVDSQSRFKYKTRNATFAFNYLLYTNWRESGFRIYRYKITP